MKRILLIALCNIVLVLGLSAQLVQTNGSLTIDVGSARVVGDKMIISGKMTVDKEVRLMNVSVKAITADGDSHALTNFMFGGKQASTSAFDQNFQPGIPYSFDFYIETQNKNMNPLTALMVNLRSFTDKVNLNFVFKDIKVPMTPDPNLEPGVMEIGKDIYLKWTKYEESPAGLKLNFVVENKATKDQSMSFNSYNNAKIIDKDGNIYTGSLSLKEQVTFPVGTPVAGFISIEEPVKMSDVIMVQFHSYYFKYSVKQIVFTK